MPARKPRKASPPPIALGGIVREELPLPYVHYPSHYGTFFAFSEHQGGPWYLCSCSEASLANYLELRRNYSESYPLYNSVAHLDRFHLPDWIAFQIGSYGQSLNQLRFKSAICHRCNLVPPSMRYCHEMYGVKFIQYFGWYVNLAYLRFGILPSDAPFYLNGITPDELIADIRAIVEAREAQHEAYSWLTQRHDHGITDEEIWERQDKLRDAERQLRQADRALSKKIEDVVREEFGFKKIGERWTSETLLFTILRSLLPEATILRHLRPEWLGGLEIDIYLPEFNIAIEYQGQQHFHPIEAWGGEVALREVQERDKRKARLCAERGVVLLEFDYTEPLVREYIQQRFQTALLG